MASNASALCLLVSATATFNPEGDLRRLARQHAGVRRESENRLGGVEGGSELFVRRRECAGVTDRPGQVGALVQREERHATLDRVLHERRQHVRPVHFERGVALLERQPRGGLVGLGDRRVGARCGRDGLDGLQRLDRGGAMFGRVGQRDFRPVVGEHLAACAFQQGVEPHHQAFVLLALRRNQLGSPAACRRVAVSTMPSQVCGGSGTRSARYHNNWVLVVMGTA